MRLLSMNQVLVTKVMNIVCALKAKSKFSNDLDLIPRVFINQGSSKTKWLDN